MPRYRCAICNKSYNYPHNALRCYQAHALDEKETKRKWKTYHNNPSSRTYGAKYNGPA